MESFFTSILSLESGKSFCSYNQSYLDQSINQSINQLKVCESFLLVCETFVLPAPNCSADTGIAEGGGARARESMNKGAQEAGPKLFDDGGIY